ncbi:3-oxoacyl-reductase [Trichodelitschia bisporula]|uniref:3-oxoacyl-reductase n=1 Tax=Trichodelitschia bisporula TaxID=703511 RepID=A0A6G1HIU8_9PEZI|nr:3-oxoacyl-reductase [Trichodelitschia bisporula]
MSQQLLNKVAIVTGGSSGIGASIVRLFLDHGAKVASLDIRQSAEPDSDTLLSVTANVASDSEVRAAVAKVVEKWSTVDILVNNAGVMDRATVAGDVLNPEWERCMGVNLNGPFYLIRAVMPHFQAHEGDAKGVIVNIGSTASVRGAAAGPAYTASKHGLLGLSRNVAWWYRHKGVRCNIVLPGGVETNIAMNSLTGPVSQEGMMEAMQRMRPYIDTMPGMLKPRDIANAVLFLATAEGVNGAEIAVDKGWTTA